MSECIRTAEQLVPGRRYHISISDCCVSADIQGTFVQHTYDEDGTIDTIIFDTITFDRAYDTAVFFTEIPDANIS